MAATRDLEEDKQVFKVSVRSDSRPTRADFTKISKKLSPLLDLPPEIWSTIGRLVIDSAASVNLSEIYASFVENTFLPDLQQPAITRVCSAMRQELLPYYYQTRVGFQIWSDFASREGHQLDPRLEWLVTIGRCNRKHIRGVSLIASPAEVDLARWRYRDCLGLEFDVEIPAQEHCNGRILAKFAPAKEEQVAYGVRFL